MNMVSPTGPNGGSWIAINGNESSINASAAQPTRYAPRRATAAPIIATPSPMLPSTVSSRADVARSVERANHVA